jgi:hypothetical protein
MGTQSIVYGFCVFVRTSVVAEESVWGLALVLYSEMSWAMRLLAAARMQDWIVVVIMGDDISEEVMEDPALTILGREWFC